MPLWAEIFNEKMRDMLYQCYGLKDNIYWTNAGKPECIRLCTLCGGYGKNCRPGHENECFLFPLWPGYGGMVCKYDGRTQKEPWQYKRKKGLVREEKVSSEST